MDTGKGRKKMKGVSTNEQVPIYMSSTDLSWRVRAGYHINSGHLTPATNAIKREYNPMGTPNLFQQFAQLSCDNDSSIEEVILKWVSKYGTLCEFKPGLIDKVMAKEIPYKTSIEYYIEEINNARQSLDNYRAFLDTISDGCFDINGLKFAYQDTFNLFLLKDGPLSNIQLGVKLEGNPPSFRPEYIPDSLLSALWLQFWQLISNQGKLKKCHWCGKDFSYESEKNLYCPGDELSNGRSLCQNSHSKWMNKMKQKSFRLFRQDKSVKEVTAILSKEKKHIEESKVQGWWEKFNK
jgi:hypothetical protein